MPKGYIIVRMTVTDPDTYGRYAAMAGEAMRKYGVKPLARGGRCSAVEGEGRPRNVVLEAQWGKMYQRIEFHPNQGAFRADYNGSTTDSAADTATSWSSASGSGNGLTNTPAGSGA